jgi:hypothetical protein
VKQGGFEACRLLIKEIEKEMKAGRNNIIIEEEFHWRKSNMRRRYIRLL